MKQYPHGEALRGAKSMLRPMQRRAKEAAMLMKVLAHPVRLMVLCRLLEREHSVSEIGRHCRLSASALSQHLALLRSKGVVRTRRQSQHIHYSVVKGPAVEVIQALYRVYCPANRKSGSRRGHVASPSA
jgi:DNA-binding transcriptional ArsR family regulator